MRLNQSILASVLALAVLAPSTFAQAIAQIKAAEGRVEIQRDGKWRRAREGSELTVKDRVRTAGGALASIEFYDGGDGLQATTIDMVPDTEISIENFEISKSLPKQRQGFVEMAKGYLRAFTKGWSNGSVFSVKAGTTVCGIRGSVAAIRFDPGTGTATFQAASGDIFTFQATDLQSAVQMSLTFGVQLAAGQPASSMPISQLAPGTQMNTTPTGGATVVTIGPETQARLNNTATQLKQMADGPPPSLPTVIRTINQTQNVIDAITQEIVGSREVNGEISTK